ncbi:MAG: 4Fe-4S binding protein [Thermoplasmata archaeon]|nr:4Fe-4S binding protein [Thermoplasmata archaeon]
MVKKVTVGAVVPWPGSTAENKTGSWRTLKPVIHHEKCIRCAICWMYCPEPAILKVDPDKYPAPEGKPAIAKLPAVEIDYDYCKGCGICAEECPVNAIEMVEEVK